SGGEAISAVMKDVNHRHLLTATLDSPPLFSGMRSLRAYPDEARGLEVNSLLSSGARSWASHDPRVLGGRRPTFVAGRDVNGPLNVGLEVSLPAAAGNDSPRTRIIAFGDADFVSNRFLDYLGNKDLLLNSINWLSRHEALIAPRAKAKKPGKHQFFVSQAEGRRLFWAAVVVQPGLFLAAGVLVLLVRRFSS
ncbi:MAG: hypothetical protein VCA74_04890, partial [Deltaproteobacteria bacterium]